MFKNGLLSVISIIISLFVIEVALHFYAEVLPHTVQKNLIWARTNNVHYFSPKFLVRDRELGWYFRPNVNVEVTVRDRVYSVKTTQVRSNDVWGFRDDGVEMPVYAMAVGDSYTDGWSVEAENNWVELLEHSNNGDVVNLGTRAWSSIHYALMVEEYITELRPEVVFWAFFINDLHETGTHLQILEEQLTENLLERTIYGLHNRSALWELYRYVRRSGPYIPVSNNEPLPPYYIQDFGVTLYPKIWTNRVDLSNPIVQTGLSATKEYLLGTHTLAETNGAELVVLIFPSAEQVYGPYVQKQLSAADFQMALGEESLDYLDRPADLILEFCAQEKLACLDLSPGFRVAANQGQALYINEDQHWNEAGNVLAASLIQEYVDTHIK